MDPRGRPVYKEWTPWPGWIVIVFWGTMVLAMAAVLVSGGDPPEERILGAVILGIVAVAVQWLVAGLSVRLYPDAIVMGIGSSGWISKRVPFDQVVAMESVRYHPIRDFGGWGIRSGSGGKRAWTARGDQAVVLELGDGTRLYVGSDHPHRLEERIRALAGTRLGASGSRGTRG